jgi:hypothetical protein
LQRKCPEGFKAYRERFLLTKHDSFDSAAACSTSDRFLDTIHGGITPYIVHGTCHFTIIPFDVIVHHFGC